MMNTSSHKIEVVTMKVNAIYTIEMYNDLMSMGAERSIINQMMREEMVIKRANKIDQLFDE